MNESYKEFVGGLVVGALMVLFLQGATILFGLRKIVKKQKYKDIYHRDIIEDPSEALVKLLGIATKECTDLAWLNISLQRFFYEVSRSSTFYEKVKATLVKKLSIAFSSGILKRVRFKDVSFGSEAPYITKIRALSENELEEILERADGEMPEPLEKPAMFSQIYLLIDIEYLSEDNCFYIDADLIKGYSIPIMVKLQPFKGQMLMRMPANNYATRFEICFIKNPGFDFSVDAAFSKNDSVFFSSSVSSILKQAFKYMAKMYIYPSWYYYYLPMLVSRSKVITYPYYPISENSRDGPKHQATEVQNLFSLDFSIVAKKGNIIFRKTKSTVNASECSLDSAEVEVAEERMAMIDEMLKSPEKFDPFAEVISDYEGFKVVEKYSESVFKIHILIAGSIYEFIKIAVEDMILFQLADPTEPQFIAIKKGPRIVTIMQYTHADSPFRLGRFRIVKLATKLEQQEMKVFGSTKLFKILDYSVKQAEKTKKIFQKSKEKNIKPLQSASKNLSKLQYISDSHISETTPAPASVSEVSIIESHFRSIETKILTEDKEPNIQISFPCTDEALKHALTLSIVRAAILGRFMIMEDIELAETIRTTSMVANSSGQYVQLLSYQSQDSKFVIQRILLSEEFHGCTLAMRIHEGKIDIFTYGNIHLRLFEFKALIHATIAKDMLEMASLSEIPKNFVGVLENCAGVILSSSTATLCDVIFEREGKTFSGTVSLDQPLYVIMCTTPGTPFNVSIKSRKKMPLLLAQIPDTEVKDIFLVDGRVYVKKKGTIAAPATKGLAHWNTPWVTPEKGKPENNGAYANGSGCIQVTEETTITWENRTGKDGTFPIAIGSVNGWNLEPCTEGSMDDDPEY
ncbi:hypothetical protein NEDG_00426 [Nematocida displodere]|uniref:SMP-LTD domain-containing protein n=1 Tax=Nematocida displodere TaxID=1805483 RepID=A0A177EKG5_9MICR|nr:hypothetical protein NEDG_00426 [Nematocida displodere]